MIEKSYSEMMSYPTYEERFKYLMLNGHPTDRLFGMDRYINQSFYHSKQWRQVRDAIIIRDCGCDLGDPDRPIAGRIYIHHINPLVLEDFDEGSNALIDPENLVCCSRGTHDALHYSDDCPVNTAYKPRTPNDTKLW